MPDALPLACPRCRAALDDARTCAGCAVTFEGAPVVDFCPEIPAGTGGLAQAAMETSAVTRIYEVAFRPALTMDESRLPSRCEVFNVFADLPHRKFSNEKVKRVLGWRPTHNFEHIWKRGLGTWAKE